jgi:NitT/TauT family transport system substrate-binding protein
VSVAAFRVVDLPIALQGELVSRVKTANLARRASIAVIVAAVTLVAGCSSSSSDDTDHPSANGTIKVGVPASIDAAPIYIGLKHGLFKDHGLDVQAVPLKPGEGLLQLANHEIDILLTDYVSLFKAQAQGKDLRILAEGYQAGPGTNEVVVPAGSSITKPADLAGKEIAVDQTKGFGELLTTASLAANNIAMPHYKQVPFDEMTKALKDGSVQAAYMPEPYISAAEQGSKDRPAVHRLLDTAEGPTADVPLSGYVATASWTKRYKDLTAAFIAGLTAAKEVAVDRTEVEDALINYMKISKQTAALVQIGEFPDSLVPDRLQRVANNMSAQPGFFDGSNTELVVQQYTQR